MLAFLLVASFAFACAEDAPEDRIIDTLETMHDTIENATDCNKLSKDIDGLCKDMTSAMNQLVKDAMNIRSEKDLENFMKKFEKIENAMSKFEKIPESECAKDQKVLSSIDSCFDALDTSLGDDL